MKSFTTLTLIVAFCWYLLITKSDRYDSVFYQDVVPTLAFLGTIVWFAIGLEKVMKL